MVLHTLFNWLFRRPIVLFGFTGCTFDSILQKESPDSVNHIQRFEQIELVFPGGNFLVELANENHEIALGFRFRPQIKEMDAMLFTLDKNAIQSLSMENVSRSLSYVFLNEEGRVIEFGNLDKGTVHPIHVEAKYLLEFHPDSNNYFQIRENSVIFGLPEI